MRLESSLQITVIICAYTEDRWDELVLSIKSIQAQVRQPFQTILVIDHNSLLFQRARREFQNIQIIENMNDQGLSGARNSGISLATGEILAFMDEDAVAAPDWLSVLTTAYQDVSVMGTGGMIQPVWVEQKPAWFPDEFNWVVGCTYRGVPEHASPVRNLIGCNMSFRREAFEKVGGFRSNMGRIGTVPLGCEETEFCIRLKQHWPTCSFIYEPLAVVKHRVPAARARFSYFRARCYAEGLSKALVSQFVGPGDGLASERAYTFRILPEGVFRGVADFFRHGEWSGLGRAAAIIGGLMITAWGYLVGKISMPKLNNQLVPKPITDNK